MVGGRSFEEGGPVEARHVLWQVVKKLTGTSHAIMNLDVWDDDRTACNEVLSRRCAWIALWSGASQTSACLGKRSKCLGKRLYADRRIVGLGISG